MCVCLKVFHTTSHRILHTRDSVLFILRVEDPQHHLPRLMFSACAAPRHPPAIGCHWLPGGCRPQSRTSPAAHPAHHHAQQQRLMRMRILSQPRLKNNPNEELFRSCTCTRHHTRGITGNSGSAQRWLDGFFERGARTPCTLSRSGKAQMIPGVPISPVNSTLLKVLTFVRDLNLSLDLKSAGGPVGRGMRPGRGI